jgi:UDPglucose 6-dehydrogenase
MRAVVVGLGYVGLVTATCLAEWDHDVAGYDADPARVAALRSGRIPFHEPGLDGMVERHVAHRRLEFAESIDVVRGAEVAIVAVGTHDGDGGWQTATLRSCLTQIVPLLADHAVLVIRSTLPPGFVRQLPLLVSSLRADVGLPPIAVLLNPEFTKEGTAIEDFLHPDRVVFGVVADVEGRGVAALRRLYRRCDAPVHVVAGIDACLAKLASNLFLATKISFANELARLVDVFDGDVADVVEIVGGDSRIGRAFLRSGVGFGGSCLPNQVTMVARTAAQHGVASPLIDAVETTNRVQREHFVALLEAHLGGLAGRRIALLGLTFKPATDDIRDAPSIEIVRLLHAAGATVVAHDPMATARARVAAMEPQLTVVETAEEAIRGADGVGLVTEWPEYRELPWEHLRSDVASGIVVDGRNALDPGRLTGAGFSLVTFGRGVHRPAGVAAPALQPRVAFSVGRPVLDGWAVGAALE